MRLFPFYAIPLLLLLLKLPPLAKPDFEGLVDGSMDRGFDRGVDRGVDRSLDKVCGGLQAVPGADPKSGGATQGTALPALRARAQQVRQIGVVIP